MTSTTKHRKAHHVEEREEREDSRVLVFFKTHEKARKAIIGAAYNLASRVLAGVIAGWIITSYVSPPQPNVTQPLTPEQTAAILGSTLN